MRLTSLLLPKWGRAAFSVSHIRQGIAIFAVAHYNRFISINIHILMYREGIIQ